MKITKSYNYLGFLLATLLCSNTFADSCTILLHGLARSSSSMEKLEKLLLEKGHAVVNKHYPSRKHDIETLANIAIPSSLKECPKEANINFVTHSLGGILVRQYLSEHKIPQLSRVVMLGPPNQGSEVVDKLGHFPGFEFINGDAGMQLGTGQSSIPNTLGPATFDVGIIAGSKTINFILSEIIPGTDDGKVSIERTKLEGMQDHITLPVTHPFMMKNDKVIEQVIYYLEFGKFKS